MEDNMDMEYLLGQVLESSRKQERYARWQCIFSAAAALCCAVVLVVLIGVLPRLDGMLVQAEAVLSDVQQMSSQLAKADWEGLTSDLENVSREIAQANLGGLAQDVTGLVQSSQAGLEQTLAKLNAIDLEGLNKAIADLSAVIQPMARFATLFGG